MDRWDFNKSAKVYYHKYPPVISSDASSTRPCGLFILLIVVGIDVGLLSLLFQDLSKLVFANAAKKCAHIMGFLDHPLQTTTKTHQFCRLTLLTEANIYSRLSNKHKFGCTWPTWAIFIEFCVAPPAWYSTLNFFTSSSNLHTEINPLIRSPKD